MMNQVRTLTCIAALLLAACGEAPESPAPAPEPAADEPVAQSLQTDPAPTNATAPQPQSAPSVPAVTLHELMRDVIEPNAQRIWRAVSYTATAGGVEETMPVNDMDWDGLRHSATTLIEAAHGLTLEGRDVGGAAYDAVRLNYQYTAEEIAARQAGNPEDWNAIAIGMSDLTREIMATIERRDILALTETGAALNQACEACHASYWIKP
jgi:hypothetical protein